MDLSDAIGRSLTTLLDMDSNTVMSDSGAICRQPAVSNINLNIQSNQGITKMDTMQPDAEAGLRRGQPADNQDVQVTKSGDKSQHMPSTADDGLDSWCTTNNLNKETRALLKKQGFTTLNALKLLSSNTVNRLGQLPLAQELYLSKALESLKDDQESSSKSHGGSQRQATDKEIATSKVSQVLQPTAPTDQMLQLSDLIQQIESGSPKEQPSQGMSFNPRFYLEKGPKAKCLNIVDFVPNIMTANDSKVVTEGGEDGRLVLELGPKKPKLENVTPHQWGAANARIMYELMKNGDIKGDQIYDYLCYTVKINELAVF
jgi:hypothetical protein